MKQNSACIIVILDRSGSMGHIWTDTVGGLSQFIKDQQALPGEAMLTLAVFDDSYNLIHDNTDIKKLDPSKPFGSHIIAPRGSTALRDAIGKTFNSVGARLAALPEDQRPDQVIVGIFTDGEENASQEFSVEQIREMLKVQQETYSWKIAFFGANIDSVTTAGNLGVGKGMAGNYAASGAGIRAATTVFSTASARYRSGAAPKGYNVEDAVKDAGVDLGAETKP